jgi:hypothetical protein
VVGGSNPSGRTKIFCDVKTASLSILPFGGNSNRRQKTSRFDNFAGGEVDRPQGEPSVSEAEGPKAPK